MGVSRSYQVGLGNLQTLAKGNMMKSSLAIIALVLAAAVSGPAVAQVPANPEDCAAAGGVWDEAAGICRPAQEQLP